MWRGLWEKRREHLDLLFVQGKIYIRSIHALSNLPNNSSLVLGVYPKTMFCSGNSLYALWKEQDYIQNHRLVLILLDLGRIFLPWLGIKRRLIWYGCMPHRIWLYEGVYMVICLLQVLPSSLWPFHLVVMFPILKVYAFDRKNVHRSAFFEEFFKILEACLQLDTV